MVKILILAAALAAAGCASRHDGPLPSNPRAIWCEHNSPRRDATQDTRREELDEINKHNTLGAAWCGWKP